MGRVHGCQHERDGVNREENRDHHTESTVSLKPDREPNKSYRSARYQVQREGYLGMRIPQSTKCHACHGVVMLSVSAVNGFPKLSVALTVTERLPRHPPRLFELAAAGYSRAMPESESVAKLLTVEGETELANRLMECTSIRKFDDPHQAEAPAIADALGDLETVFRKYLDELLPRVIAASTCDALEKALFDIQLEFQEVVWHLWYPKFFRTPLLGQDCHPDFINTSLRP